MKHIWTVACSRAVIDQDSNNVSLQNVIEQLNIADDPTPDGVLPIEVHLITLWSRADLETPSQGKSRVRFLTPSGKVLGTFESDIDLSESERLRLRLRFASLPLRESGIHSFRVDLKKAESSRWRNVAEIPIDVRFGPTGAQN